MGLEDFLYQGEEAPDEDSPFGSELEKEFFNHLAKEVLTRLPASGFYELDVDKVDMVLMGPGKEQPEVIRAKGLGLVGMVALSTFLQARIQRHRADHGDYPVAMAIHIEVVFDEST